jgi:uncharacterized protein YndB with AHSA1/START domain
MKSSRPSAVTSSPQATIVIERTYRASIEDLWALWTTKAGFEAWWGPAGCHVKVHDLETRAGGALEYDMIADSPDAIAETKNLGLPPFQRTRAWFGEFRPHQRLTLVHGMDFISNAEPREHTIEVDFSSADGKASMVVTVHPHVDPRWTRVAVEAFKCQLARLDSRFEWLENERVSARDEVR